MWLLLLSLLFSANAKRELWARVSDRDGFKLKANCFFSGHQPQAYRGGLLLRVNCSGESDLFGQLVFIQKNAATQILYRSPEGHLLSDPVTDGQDIFISEYNESGTRGLFKFTLNTMRSIPLPKKCAHAPGTLLEPGKTIGPFSRS